MEILRSGTSLIANAKFQDVAQILPEECAQTIIADWPFNKGIVDHATKRLISDGVRYANKLLAQNGTLISVNYIEPNFHVWEQAKHWGLTFGDHITVLRHPMKKVKHRLTYETLSILVFTKGKIEDRILQTKCRNKGSNLIYSKDFWNTETNFWGNSKFRNGYWRKNGDCVSEAMPATFVEKLLSIFCTTDSVVVDFFGGAGTIPVVCNKMRIKCISTEILPNRFQIILRRLSEKNKELVSYSKLLLDKALEEINSEPYTKGERHGQRRQGKRSTCCSKK